MAIRVVPKEELAAQVGTKDTGEWIAIEQDIKRTFCCLYEK